MKVFGAFALQLACGAAMAAHASGPLMVTVTVVRPAPVAVQPAAGSAQQFPAPGAPSAGSAQELPSPPAPDVSLRTREDVQYLVVEY